MLGELEIKDNKAATRTNLNRNIVQLKGQILFQQGQFKALVQLMDQFSEIYAEDMER